ncbi:MAG TPA: DUF4070 domain-containing protein, partial [Myxococcota bacterium]|nr:DUF4070 domain-containing protein [Myxococcota bacterium]
LDAILARGNPGAVYIVDDNFIGNRKAAIELLKELVKWQEARGFPIIFGFEATLNLAQVPELLELMKAAAFQIVFCGVETPEIGALKEIHKDQNLRVPILEAIQTLNRYGLYVVSGIIFGFDTDTPDTRDNVLKFIKASNVPFLTINVLTALPRTPLWRRLETANRLVDATNRESNIEFLLPYDQVVEAWRSCVVAAYEPGALLDRFDYQLDHVFPNRRKLPASPARTSWSMMSRGLKIFARIFWVIGGKMPYRRRFWQTAFKAIRQGQLEELVTVAITAYHLIIFGQEAGKGQIRAGLYNPNPEEVAA